MSEPPPRKIEQIDTHEDADFGTMRLIQDSFHSKPPGGAPWREHVMYYWEGEIGAVVLTINVEGHAAFPDVPATLRALILGHARNPAPIRRDVATRLLDTAKDWAASGELPEPTLEAFDAAITLANIATDESWTLSLYFEEASDDPAQTIFSGHVIEVHCEADGSIESAHLAG